MLRSLKKNHGGLTCIVVVTGDIFIVDDMIKKMCIDRFPTRKKKTRKQNEREVFDALMLSMQWNSNKVNKNPLHSETDLIVSR